jgi:hypothetical protein
MLSIIFSTARHVCLNTLIYLNGVFFSTRWSFLYNNRKMSNIL